MSSFKVGERVYYAGENLWGTVIDKPSNKDRVWVNFDYLPKEYGLNEDTTCHTLISVLVSEEIYNSPLYQSLKEDEEIA